MGRNHQAPNSRSGREESRVHRDSDCAFGVVVRDELTRRLVVTTEGECDLAPSKRRVPVGLVLAVREASHPEPLR